MNFEEKWQLVYVEKYEQDDDPYDEPYDNPYAYLKREQYLELGHFKPDQLVEKITGTDLLYIYMSHIGYMIKLSFPRAENAFRN